MVCARPNGRGVFQAVDVFLNGEFVLRHTSGYLGFDVPLDAALLRTYTESALTDRNAPPGGGSPALPWPMMPSSLSPHA